MSTDRTTMTGLDYATCPTCGKEVSVRLNGTLRTHTQPRAHRGEQFPPHCPDSGKTAPTA